MLLSRDFLLQALPSAKFYCSGVEQGLSNEWNFHAKDTEVSACFDSRNIKKNSLFFALKGQSVDGHNFVAQALRNGAAAFVVSNLDCLKSIEISNFLVILVHDTKQALIDLATAWRAKLSCPVIGITGSIGKTSTKEILRSILKNSTINSYFSEKNQNTLICMCSNILSVKTNCNAIVQEIGIDSPGEMTVKANILRPTIALITTISFSHVKHFGNIQNIAFEKRQLFKNLGDNGIGIISGDLPLLNNVCYAHPIARFGFKTRNNVQAKKINLSSTEDGEMFTEFLLNWYGQKSIVRFNSIHRGMLNNVLAASTIAYFLNIPFEVVKLGIENYTAFENRFEHRKFKVFKGFVISDCYNANPESMKVAINAFDTIQTKAKKVAVIGDMLELGTREVYWHRFVGRLLNRASSVEKVILVGDLVKYVAGMLPDNMILAKVSTWQEADVELKKLLEQNECAVLVKASHGIALNKLVDSVTN